MANQPTPAQQAAAIVHAQYVPIDYALAQQRASDAKAQAALQAAGHALIAQLQGGIKPAGQAYDAAVNQQQALAQGGAHLLAGLNPNAQIQSNLQQIGAPVEQQQMLARQTQAQFPGQGGVLNIEQGTIPGASLVAQKAAAQQFLAGLPALAGLSQQRSAQGLAAQAAQNRQALYGQRLQAAAQIPQLAYNIGQAATNRQFQANQAAASRSFQAQQADLQRTYQAEQNRLGRQLTPYEKAQIAAQKNAANATKTGQGVKPVIVATKDGGHILVNPVTGKVIKQVNAPIGTGTPGQPDISPTQKRAATAEAHKLVGQIRANRAAAAAGHTNQNGDPPTLLTYDQAVQQAEQRNIPLPIAVRLLNTIYPAQYMVTKRGTLKQIGIRGQPNWKPK